MSHTIAETPGFMAEKSLSSSIPAHTNDAFVQPTPPPPTHVLDPHKLKSLLTQLDVGQHDLVGFWDRRWNIAAYKPHEIEVRCVKHVFVV